MSTTTKSIGTTGSYSDAVSTTRAAIGGELTSVNKWQKAGTACLGHFGSETMMREIKAQFIADAILPELNKSHRDAMAKELPRKGSADFVACVGAHGAQAWETANQAKKDARSTCDTMFNRVVGYAFPKDKKESTPTPTKTKIVELINDAIKKAQKDESPDYDVATLIAQLQAALATASK
jgi:hypothetical protein